jgi:hypothetical protein
VELFEDQFPGVAVWGVLLNELKHLDIIIGFAVQPLPHEVDIFGAPSFKLVVGEVEWVKREDFYVINVKMDRTLLPSEGLRDQCPLAYPLNIESMFDKER